ncbi:RebB family R body protein [Chryseobacterium sp.]|uniref:RebB family R body protein n=1 Tax=Chryseobacterium sp. TaxID=1871047 RepID=UPI0025BFDAA1|nr:RebB family R body protein [Chryseobacterium sp.]
MTQSNVKVVGEAPAMALGNVYQSAAHSTGIMFENAVNAQNQQNILGKAATTQGIMQIYSLDTIADAISIAKMLSAS